jgi:putative heme transporter
MMGPENDAGRYVAVTPKVPAWLDVAAAWAWRGGLVLGAAWAVARLIGVLHVITVPLLVAAALSTVTIPIADRLERHRIGRGVTAFMFVTTTATLLTVGGWLLVPALARQLGELAPTIGVALGRILDWLERIVPSYDTAAARLIAEDPLGQLGVAATNFDRVAVPFASIVGEGAVMLLLALVLWFFITKDRREMGRWVSERLPDSHRDVIVAVGRRAWRSLSGYVRGTTAVALIDAVGIGIGLWLLDVPLVVPLTLLVFFGSYIPIVGATVTGLIAALVALADGGLGVALAVTAVVIVVQQVESHLL